MFYNRLLVEKKQDTDAENEGDVSKEKWNELVAEPLPMMHSIQDGEYNVCSIQENYMSEDQVEASITQFIKKDFENHSGTTQPISPEHERISEFESDLQDFDDDDSDYEQG